MKKDVVIVEHFYKDPEKVIAYAKTLSYYDPYSVKNGRYTGGEANDASLWISSRFATASTCPFKSSDVLISALESATGEQIDYDHWCDDSWASGWPLGRSSNGLAGKSVRWNCTFHVKRNSLGPGTGVHNHVTDTWNAVGVDGWAGIVYLSKNAPVTSGLYLWKNKSGNDYQWGGNEADWQLTDSFGNFYNRLVLVRGKYPHSGGAGWGRNIEEGRFFQTFFFRTKNTELNPADFTLPKKS